MNYVFTVSPDFSPDYLGGWFVFNTWLQRVSGLRFHLELMDHFPALRQAIEADRIDLIYANPHDAAILVREKGFVALAKPGGGADEAVIAVSGDSPFQRVEDLEPGSRIATTGDPDVHLMGMILLEPAGLNRENVTLHRCDSYVLVAKRLFRGESDAGIFLARAFDELSRPVRERLRVLVRSDIQVIHHYLMAGPRLADRVADLRKALTAMGDDPKTAGILKGLGVSRWEAVDEEEVEFMIDLMDTLSYSSA